MTTPLHTKAPLFRRSEKRIITLAVVFLTATLVATVAMAGLTDSPNTTASQAFVSDMQKRGFNPQPEPPAAATAFTAPGSLRAFNPQPEPPASALSLNPQPEPPSRLQLIRN